jgi:hypothetical protein
MERTLSDQDLLDILEDVARNLGNAAARIAAVKQLMALAADPDRAFAELIEGLGGPRAE